MVGMCEMSCLSGCEGAVFGVKALQVQPGELGVLNSQVREIEDTVDGL